jgi:hypothetical protein
MTHANGGVRTGRANAPVVSDRLLALTTEALAFVSRGKAEDMARQWLAGAPFSHSNGQSVLARSLALELALSVPFLKGTTAFDRLARTMIERPPEDIAAVTLLRRSRLRLARLSGEKFEDLATGEILPLLPTPPSDAAGDSVVFGRFTTTEDGHTVATGTLVVLDNGAPAVARGFVRPDGRGVGNPVRCAEAVYRHIIRNGAATADWRGRIGGKQSKLPFEPDRDPLDALSRSLGVAGPRTQPRGTRSSAIPCRPRAIFGCAGQRQHRSRRRGAQACQGLWTHRFRHGGDNGFPRPARFGARRPRYRGS